ncbi:hypothetical protein HDF16_000819 [Granulicella aggregans]|uniref:GlcNAc-PI de-N-acetylase n=2 Tax=Granulicella aggregans TaxID=474949 RepID=A0A7W8E3H5_9BACT|nr:hypothetical protein [Granulicella aggregans]
MRRKEDGELLKLLPKLRMEDLNLKDAPIRLRCGTDGEFTVAPAADDSAVVKIQKALAKLDAEMKIDAVLLPLGLGHHVDHLVARNAALDFGATRACAFYEDLPDALRNGDAFDTDRDTDPAVHDEVASLSQTYTPVLLKSGHDAENGIKRKLKMVSVYASQIDEPTMQTISNFATRYGAGERVWANETWVADGRLTSVTI